MYDNMEYNTLIYLLITLCSLFCILDILLIYMIYRRRTNTYSELPI